MRSKLFQGIALGLAATVVAAMLQLSGMMSRLEAVTWDWRVRLMARPGAATGEIVQVFLDQASLDWGKNAMGLEWPWPREIYTAILGFCRMGGARAVAFDVLFTEPSERMDQDALLGEAIAVGAPFAGAVFFGDGRAAFPIPEVATNATVLGSVMGDADADGVIRRIRTEVGYEGRTYPTLGLATWLAQAPGSEIKLPVDRTGKTILRWRGPSQKHLAISAQAVVQSYIRIQSGETPVVEPSVVSNKYVLFGFTAPGLMDLRSTPISPIYPGVEIHATLLDNFLSGDAMRDAPTWMALLAIALLAVGSGLLGRYCGQARWVIVQMLLLLPLPFGVGLAGYAGGWWVPVAAPVTGVALALVGAVVLNYAMEGRQKRFIKGAFKQYLSPVVIEALVKHPERLQLGGELRELSIFFSDVQGFTGISESLGPEALTDLLNTYLTAMTNIIMDEGGTIDKYEGDAIIAFWNAPLDLPDHPERAVRAALGCQRRLEELRTDFRARYGKELHARIGLNTGQVVVGNMGSDQRFDYTFLGDAGNLAARLEGVNKQFGTYILISEKTARRLPDSMPRREVALVKVVGRAEPVRVFEPWDPAAWEASKAGLDTFAGGLAAYYAGQLDEALPLFSSVAETDPVAAAYVRRCHALQTAPPAAWQGVWEMTEK